MLRILHQLFDAPPEVVRHPKCSSLCNVVMVSVSLVALGVCLLLPTVARAQTTVYWDTNGRFSAGSGSTSGNWGTSSYWTLSSTGLGSVSPTTWSAVASGAKIATFSAGTNATGTFTATVSSTITNVAGITFGEGNVSVAGTGALTLTNSGTISVGAGSATTATISAILGGTVGMTKTDSGTLILSGANNYTGATTISGGTLQLGASNVLPNSTAVTVAGGAALNLNTYSDTIGSLSGSGTVTLGTGTLTLGGNMNLSAGSLSLNGLNGKLVLASGSTNSVGTLSVTQSSTIDFGTGSGSILNVSSLTIASGATLTIANWSDAADFFYLTTLAGSSLLSQIQFTGYNPATYPTKWQTWSDNQVTPVPEPATYGAALLGLGTLLAGWRRFRRLAV